MKRYNNLGCLRQVKNMPCNFWRIVCNERPTQTCLLLGEKSWSQNKSFQVWQTQHLALQKYWLRKTVVINCFRYKSNTCMPFIVFEHLFARRTLFSSSLKLWISLFTFSIFGRCACCTGAFVVSPSLHFSAPLALPALLLYLCIQILK